MADTYAAAISQASATGELRLHDQRLERLPEDVRRLQDLKKLDVSGCRLSSLPEWLPELESLESLDLGGNPFSGLPSSVWLMPSLRELGMSGAPLRSISAVGTLTRLEVLVLSGVGLKTLPATLGSLINLRVLDLGGNPIQSVSPALERLDKLTQLHLWGHRLPRIPKAIASLTRLELLDLSQGGAADLETSHVIEERKAPLSAFVGMFNPLLQGLLTELPDWVEAAFPSLRWLMLGRQQLTSLPAKLPATLEGVYLSHNSFRAVPPALFALRQLRELDLSDNRLDHLPPELGGMGTLTYLNLIDNPLPIPPEVLAQTTTPNAIREYASGVQGPTRHLNQAKLLFVGEGSVGKTSLVKRLVSGTFSEHERKTKGIEVTRWSVAVDNDDILLNVWDFGGQEIMHATHQFFLTKRSLYVLVLDARQGEEQNRIEYWLKLIQGFSDGSPVVVVGNKCEDSALDIDSRGLSAKYPNILAILATSCKTGAGIPEIANVLADAIDQMPHVRDLLPEAYFDVKSDLEALDADYLSYSSYEQLCARRGVTTQSSQELLVGFLHDLGTVLCFRDDPRLSDTNILNPEWVTGGVYRLLNSHLAAQRKGLLRWDDVDAILDGSDYPPNRRAFIVDMMKRFELCFESDGIYLVPDLLTKEEPDTGEWEGGLDFEVQYDVLPSSVLSRLIVRMHDSISRGTVWRTGLVVTMDRNRALVRADREDGVIRITVVGPMTGRRGVLAAIRSELQRIGRTIPGLTAEERVPIPGYPGIWVPYRHLIDLEAAGRSSVVPQGLTQDFSVRGLLAGVEEDANDSHARSTLVASSLTAPERAPADAQVSEAAAWSAVESLRFGRFLIGALVLVVAVFAGVNQVLGTEAAAARLVALSRRSLW